jgi:hypothetical protein
MESKRELKAGLEDICLANVQACIIVGNLCGAEGNNDSEALFFGTSSSYVTKIPELMENIRDCNAHG